MHTTNYINTFIEVAEDCPAASAQVPPIKLADKSVATLQYEMLIEHPYTYTSDDVIFGVFASRNQIQDGIDQARASFFSKGQACMRASPLTKRYGWGVHSDEEGKIAIFPMESDEYKAFVANSSIKKTRGMRSKRG